MKNKLSRIGAALTAFVLIGLILWVTNSFVGNPISKHLASRDIKNYIKTTYPALDVVLTDTNYSFKFGEYYGYVESPTSKDTYFNITWRHGEIINDSYTSNVVECWNTIARFEKEAQSQVQPIVSAIPGVKEDSVYINFEKESYESLPEGIVLDAAYDKSLPLPLEFNIFLEVGTPTLEGMAAMLTELHKLLTASGYHFTYYNIELSSDTIFFNGNSIPPEAIEGGHLLDFLTKAYEDYNKENSTSNKEKEEDESIEKKPYVYSFEK